MRTDNSGKAKSTIPIAQDGMNRMLFALQHTARIELYLNGRKLMRERMQYSVERKHIVASTRELFKRSKHSVTIKEHTKESEHQC